MNDLKLRTYPHKDLLTKCESVPEEEFGSFELEILCGKMLTVMRTFEALGLAANQVGVHKRIFAFEHNASDGIDRPDVEIPEIFINPEIIVLDKTIERYFTEGCLSFPGTRPKIKRQEYFALKFRNTSGDHLELGPDVCCGLFGHAFQHEIDHLDGLTMLDKADMVAKNNILKHMKKIRRKRL